MGKHWLPQAHVDAKIYQLDSLLPGPRRGSNLDITHSSPLAVSIPILQRRRPETAEVSPAPQSTLVVVDPKCDRRADDHENKGRQETSGESIVDVRSDV